MKERKDIDQKYKWDLTKIYATEADFTADFDEAQALIKDFPKHEKTMCQSAKGLLDAIKASSYLGEKINKLWSFAHLSFATDTSNNSAQAREGRVRSLAAAADAASWFVSPYLLRLDEKTVEDWYKEETELENYRRMIYKVMREKPHTLSDECEKMLAGMGDCLGTHEGIRSIFANSDLQFGKIRDENGKLFQLTDVNYVPTLMKSDRKVRRAAFQSLYKTYAQYGNTFATTYEGYVKERCIISKMRGYKSSLEASVFGDEVTPKIYNSLIKSVRSSLPVIHDYYELKREVLGVEKLHMYDVYAPLVSECESEYSYETAVDEVLDAVKVLGKEYYDTLKSGLTERGWVDVYPSKGKVGGAFSAACPSTEPYILLNFADSLEDVSILAHEAGHSMHSYFSTKYNQPHEARYTIFVAEVASTVNELLLAHKKLRECKSDDEKLSILNGLMETYKGTLYRQTMFAEFEKNIHALSEKGEPLTAEVILGVYMKLIRAYFGPKVAKDKQIAYEWMRIPHFYYNFYVYKYATCISAASAIVKRIENEGASYVDKYIDFLKCGDSKSPIESLLVAGIDMTDPTVISGAIEDFASAIKSFREIYQRRAK
ncbi:MAG: oligoendopeptidase F [Ruminococcaceae bacterium]|nr:oligoendopeptidase F [Oscillospiraceae bacterium]